MMAVRTEYVAATGIRWNGQVRLMFTLFAHSQRRAIELTAAAPVAAAGAGGWLHSSHQCGMATGGDIAEGAGCGSGASA